MKEFNNEACTGTGKDARGNPVTLLDPYTLRLARRYEVIPQEALGDILAELGSGMRKSIRVMFVISLVCLAVGLVAVADYAYQWWSGGSSFSTMRRKLFGMIVVAYGPIVIWFGAKRVRMLKVVRVMLQHRRCPHCGYDLRLLPVDAADGATVCPECGHAWQLIGPSTPCQNP